MSGVVFPEFEGTPAFVATADDVTETTVEVLAIMAKQEAESWLAQFAKPA